MSRNLFILIIVVIVLAVVVLVGFLLFGKNTPAVTTSPSPTIQTLISATTKPSPTATPVSSPVKPLESLPVTNAVSGKITAICGGLSNQAGIGSAQGTCDRCQNLQGTDGSCHANSGESISVWACDSTTANKCDLTVGGTELAASIVTQTVFLSNYFSHGCTIELTVENATSTTPVDYIVWQKDNCIAASPTTKLCGATCADNLDCPSGTVCSASSKCVLVDCNTDPSKCVLDNQCALKSTTNVTAPGICGSTCTTGTDCSSGNVCVDGTCKATECLPDSAVGCNVDGCVVGPEKLPKTAIISDEVDLFIGGLLLLLLGVIAWKTNFHVKLFYALGGGYLTAEFSESERVKVERAELEAKMKERLQENSKAKTTRPDFEQTILAEEPEN